MSDTTKNYFLQLDKLSINGSAYSAGNIWIEDEVQIDSSVLLVLCDSSESKSSTECTGSGIIALLERNKFDKISQVTYELLIAVKVPAKRMEVYRDPTWLQEGQAIRVNSKVLIIGGSKANDSPMTGVVRFCGVISVGRLFGVELDPPFHGKGSSDGLFRRIQYFSCEEDCALFVNICRLRLLEENRLAPEQSRIPQEFGCEEPGTSLKMAVQYADYPLHVGERVVWMSDDGPEYGTVRWIGHLPDAQTNEATVGIEFDNPIGSGTGRYKSQRLFTAKRNHASLVPLMGLMKLSDYLPDAAGTSYDVGGIQFQSQGPIASYRNDLQMTQASSPVSVVNPKMDMFSDAEQKNVETIAHEVQKLDLKVRQAPIRGRVMPPSVAADAVDSLCGQKKGLQGHSGSCGLESTVFALFAFSSCFDNELYAEPGYQSLRATIKKVLWEQIVNPLRATNYVSADRISRYNELVSMIEKPDVCIDGPESAAEAGDDPMNALKFILSDLLSIGSLISTSSGREDYVFRIEEFDCTLLTESMQHAIERVHLSLKYWIAEVPSPVLIVEVRQLDYASPMGVILPSPLIDISDLLDGFPRDCKICGKQAHLECMECFTTESQSTQRDSPNLSDVSFCIECFGKFHQRTDRKRHKPIRLQSSLCTEFSANKRIKMELFAIVSLVKGHYVSFVVSGSAVNAPWLFYDGMAKRTVSDRRGVFIPEVRRCEEMSRCLENFRAASYPSFSCLPELVQHMIRGLRICFYRPVKN